MTEELFMFSSFLLILDFKNIIKAPLIQFFLVVLVSVYQCFDTNDRIYE